jgi:hypothetical protein
LTSTDASWLSSMPFQAVASAATSIVAPAANTTSSDTGMLK